MSSKNIWLFALASALCLAARAQAAPFMIVGNDEKIVWDDAGKPILSPAGKGFDPDRRPCKPARAKNRHKLTA